MSTGETPDPSDAAADSDQKPVSLSTERLEEIRARRPQRLRMTKVQLVDELEKVEIEWAVIGERLESALQSATILTNTQPAYPDQSQDATLRLTRPMTWRAWVGNSDRLVKLSEIAEESLRAHFETHASSKVVNPLLDHWSIDDVYRLKIEVRGAKGRIQRSGPMRTVLAETNLAEIESIFIGNDASGADRRGLPVLKVQFGKVRSYDADKIQLEISDNDRDWVASTYDRLVTEIQRDVPRWAALRSAPGRALLFVSMLAIIYGIGFPVASAMGNTPVAVNLVVYLGLFVAAMWVVLLQRFVLRTVEVLEPGRSSSAGRTAAVVLTAIGLVGAIASIYSVVR